MSLLLKNNLVWIHMPKTGGTAMRQFFKEQDIVINEFNIGPVLNSIQTNQLLVPDSRIEISGIKTIHRVPTLSQLTRGTDLSPFHAEYQVDKSNVFTFVRNPYEWYRSFFYFKMNEKKWNSSGVDYPDHLFEIQGGIPKRFFHYQVKHTPPEPPKLTYIEPTIDRWEHLFDVFVDQLWLKSISMAEGKGPISFYCQRIAQLVEGEKISPNLQIGKYEEATIFLNTILNKAGYTPQEAQRISKEFANFKYINKTSKKSEKDLSIKTMQKIYELEKDIFNLYRYDKRF